MITAFTALMVKTFKNNQKNSKILEDYEKNLTIPDNQLSKIQEKIK